MLVILVGFIVLILGAGGRFSQFPSQKSLMSQWPVALAALPRLAGLLLGATLMFVLGLFDDIRGVGFSYKLKFMVQIFAAGLVVISGTRLDFLLHPALNIFVTTLWIVGITNSFNLLDNMDGLSSGVAGIIAMILGILTIQQGQYFSALILLALAVRSIGVFVL